MFFYLSLTVFEKKLSVNESNDNDRIFVWDFDAEL